jgi:hypothetical protein
MEMSAPASSEVLAKVSPGLAHSYPGFFRAGDLRCRSCFGPRMFSGASLSKLLSELSHWQSGFPFSESLMPRMNGWF